MNSWIQCGESGGAPGVGRSNVSCVIQIIKDGLKILFMKIAE